MGKEGSEDKNIHVHRNDGFSVTYNDGRTVSFYDDREVKKRDMIEHEELEQPTTEVEVVGQDNCCCVIS